MNYSRFITVRFVQTVVCLCLVWGSMAYLFKPHGSHGGDNQHGVIPLGLFMSKLQVDVPDYDADSPSSGFTGGNKRKRHGHGENSGSCCPTVEEITEPLQGRSRSGHMLELFRQQFHEIFCAPNIEKKPCRFVDESVQEQSQFVQRYSYSYALVRDYGSSNIGDNPASGWRFEHIRIRSGCSCVISP